VKEKTALEAKLAKTTAALQSTATAYNKGKLRRVDRINPAQVTTGSRRNRIHWAHKREWSLAGTISLAVSMVGQLSKVSELLVLTTRCMDAIAVTALAVLAHLRSATRTFTISINCHARLPRFVMCMRALDCTPIPVRFGELQGDLARIARYWYQVTAATKTQRGTWCQLTAQEFLDRGGQLPKHGVVELMAQGGTLVWPDTEGDKVVMRRHLLTLPVLYVARSTSSCHLRAFNVADPSVSLQALLALTVNVRLVMIGIGSDLAASVVRMRIYAGTQVRACNAQSNYGQAALYIGDCIGHIVHREAAHCASKDRPD
jgi:hypothetical protein